MPTPRLDAPPSVARLTDVIRIAVSGDHVCAAKKNGEMMCWGQNASGEVGLSAEPFSFTPVRVLLPGVP